MIYSILRNVHSKKFHHIKGNIALSVEYSPCVVNSRIWYVEFKSRLLVININWDAC